MNDALKELVSLGIDPVKARFALTEFDNHVEAAADWCFGEGATWTPADLLNVSHEAHQGLSSEASDNVDIRLHAQSHQGQGPTAASVPRSNQVRPGVTVNIVLKQDQPTGRTVQGVVSEVLTKGDHPRGIKIRLQDGRVGRVASLA